jgi:diguanylate cyclase (GGDEF)-like protein
MSLHALVGRSRRHVRGSLLTGLSATAAAAAVCFASYALFFPKGVTSALETSVPVLVFVVLAPVVAVVIYHFKTSLGTERIKLEAARKLLRQESDQRRRLEGKLERKTRSDPLTGLANRRHFRDRLEQAAARARRTGMPLCAIKFAVDDFDKLNRQYGHAGGDDILCAVARVCLDTLREVDVPARLDDCAFGVLLENTPAMQGRAAAERLRKAIEETPAPTAAINIAVTCSFGVAQIDPRHQSIEDLLGAADSAMQQALLGGPSKVCAWREEREVVAA